MSARHRRLPGILVNASLNEVSRSPAGRTRSITRTIRIDDETDQQLIRVAQQQKFSLNQVMCTALRRYAQWEILADRIGLVHVHNRILTRLFDNIQEEVARDLGREDGANAWREMVVDLYKVVNYDNILKMLELSGRFGGRFIFTSVEDNKVNTLMLKHNQGPNTSAFLAEALKVLLHKTGQKFEVVETQDQLAITVSPGEKLNLRERRPSVTIRPTVDV